MNRREFIKSLGLVTAGSAVTIVPAVLLKEQPPPIEPIQFDKADLQRWTDGKWHLGFESEKVFNPSGKNDIVIEIGEYKLLLKNMGKVEHSWEFKGKSGKNYIHWISGDGWEEIEGVL